MQILVSRIVLGLMKTTISLSELGSSGAAVRMCNDTADSNICLLLHVNHRVTVRNEYNITF